MAKSEDINTLFRRFGGNAEGYQEIVSADQAQAAEQQWPLLGQLRPLDRAQAPDAHRAGPALSRAEQVEVVVYRPAPPPTEVPPPAAAPSPLVSPSSLMAANSAPTQPSAAAADDAQDDWPEVEAAVAPAATVVPAAPEPPPRARVAEPAARPAPATAARSRAAAPKPTTPAAKTVKKLGRGKAGASTEAAKTDLKAVFERMLPTPPAAAPAPAPKSSKRSLKW